MPTKGHSLPPGAEYLADWGHAWDDDRALTPTAGALKETHQEVNLAGHALAVEAVGKAHSLMALPLRQALASAHLRKDVWVQRKKQADQNAALLVENPPADQIAPVG